MAVAALRVVEHNATYYRRTWRGSVVLTFLSPVLFLAAMGLGLGGMIDRAAPGALSGVSYAAFLAPGLLAAQAMNTGTFESTYPIMSRILWRRTYHAVLATPLSVRDLLVGELAWISLRLLMMAAAFLAVMLLFGVVRSPLVVLAVPAAVLTGLAFAACVTAFTARQTNDSGFSSLFRFVITPLFLFSGTFFPIERLPELLRPVAYLTPLYHGVSLTRGLSLGTLDPAGAAVDVAVLAAYALGGAVAARITLGRALVK